MMRYARKLASQKTAEHMDALIERQRTTPMAHQLHRQDKAKKDAAAARAKERRAAKRAAAKPETGE